MKIKLLDYGYTHIPNRSHYNDAGADVYALNDYELHSGESYPMKLGFGIELPDGFVGFIMPRSGLSSLGIVSELSPIDAGYRGEVHAILHNQSNTSYFIKKNERIGQLVILPVVLAEFIVTKPPQRNTQGLGSTGK